MEKQPKLAQKFIKCMDLLDEGDYLKIQKNLWCFQDLYTEVNRHLEKFTGGGENKLCLEPSDLKDICGLAQPLLNKWEEKINLNRMYKNLWNCDKLNNEQLHKWMGEYIPLFDVVAKIRCFLTIMSYAYCIYDAYHKQWKQENDVDMSEVLLSTLKGQIKYGF